MLVIAGEKDHTVPTALASAVQREERNGYFGTNFRWMVERIDTPLAFVLLGIGFPLLGVALTVLLVRRGTPVQLDRGRAGPR